MSLLHRDSRYYIKRTIFTQVMLIDHAVSWRVARDWLIENRAFTANTSIYKVMDDRSFRLVPAGEWYKIFEIDESRMLKLRWHEAEASEVLRQLHQVPKPEPEVGAG